MNTAADFHTVNVTAPRAYEVKRSSDGKLIGVYPTAELAWKVCRDCDSRARRQWVKAQKSQRKESAL
jgi:hypothetical protein